MIWTDVTLVSMRGMEIWRVSWYSRASWRARGCENLYTGNWDQRDLIKTISGQFPDASQRSEIDQTFNCVLAQRTRKDCTLFTSISYRTWLFSRTRMPTGQLTSRDMSERRLISMCCELRGLIPVVRTGIYYCVTITIMYVLRVQRAVSKF